MSRGQKWGRGRGCLPVSVRSKARLLTVQYFTPSEGGRGLVVFLETFEKDFQGEPLFLRRIRISRNHHLCKVVIQSKPFRNFQQKIFFSVSSVICNRFQFFVKYSLNI